MPRKTISGKAALTSVEAARYVGLSPDTLEKMRVYGGGPIFAKLGRSVRYLIDDLDSWLASKRSASTSRRKN